MVLVKSKYSSFRETSETSWQVPKTKKSNYPALYFPLDESLGWPKNGMTEWQNSRGLSLAQPITPPVCQGEEQGSNKKCPPEMQLWRTWIQQISFCLDRDSVYHDKNSDGLQSAAWLLTNAINCEIWSIFIVTIGLDRMMPLDLMSSAVNVCEGFQSCDLFIQSINLKLVAI